MIYASDLRVVALDVFAIRIPLVAPVRMAGIVFDHAENVLVRLTSDDGTTGWGESTSGLQMTGESSRAIADSLLSVRDANRSLLPACLDQVDTNARHLLADRPAARSAWSTAVHDLAGKHAGLPVHELLSAEPSRPLMATQLLGHETPEDDLAAARAFTAAGLRSLKLKIGRRRVEVEAQLLIDLRAAIGSDVVLGADANGGMDVESAARLCGLAADAHLDYLEQPLPRETPDDYPRLRAQIDVPIALDESATSAAAIIAAGAQGGADGAVLKLQKFGGLDDLMRAALAARTSNLVIAFTGKVAETSIATAALAHVAIALGGSPWGFSPTNTYLVNDVARTPIGIVDGQVSLGPRPGLGIDVLEPTVDAFRIDIDDLT